jgi:hypothetical protein
MKLACGNRRLKDKKDFALFDVVCADSQTADRVAGRQAELDDAERFVPLGTALPQF